MSSPFSRETKRGTEESIEAISRAQTWLHRIDTKNDATELNLDEFLEELHTEKERVKEEYIERRIQTSIENFVVNHPETVIEILTGENRRSGTSTVSQYISEDFGYVRMPELTEENIVWLVAQKVRNERKSSYTSEYESDVLDTVYLNDIGKQPELVSKI